MSTTPLILNLRLSFIWNEPMLGLVSGGLQAKPDYMFLTQSSSYKEAFDSAQQGSNPLALAVPWNGPRHHFWNFYLPGSSGESVGASQAWEYSVPLRSKLSSFSIGRSAKGQLILEGYYFPLGIAVICTFHCQGRFSPEQARKLAYETRYVERFDVTIQGNPQQLSLSGLAFKALDSLRTGVDPSDKPSPRPDPSTLLTIIKGEGVNPMDPFENPEVHRMLEVVTSWPPDPDTATPTPLAKAGLTVKPATAKGSVFYASGRGRAIWFPGLFTLRKQRVSSLSCYHRNNLMGAMQVDSLGALVAGTAALLRNGTALSDLTAGHKARSRRACECLERLFTGDRRMTYRSDSLKEQVRRDYLSDLNDLRRTFSPGAKDLQ
jgi:hypothetical protein